jgi:hypothetical protein
LPAWKAVALNGLIVVLMMDMNAPLSGLKKTSGTHYTAHALECEFN